MLSCRCLHTTAARLRPALFDTRSTAQKLSECFTEEQAAVITRMTHDVLRGRLNAARDDFLTRSAMDTTKYELQTVLLDVKNQLQATRRTNQIALAADKDALQRGVERVQDRIKEDIHALRQDVQQVLNDRKAEARDEVRMRAWKVQGLSDQMSVLMSAERTVMEAAKVESMRNGLALVFVTAGIALGGIYMTGGSTDAGGEAPEGAVASRIA